MAEGRARARRDDRSAQQPDIRLLREFMPRYPYYLSNSHSGDARPQTHMDELIRPGLRRAFPAPAVDQAHDERFCRLLDALAKRRPEESQTN